MRPIFTGIPHGNEFGNIFVTRKVLEEGSTGAGRRAYSLSSRDLSDQVAGGKEEDVCDCHAVFFFAYSGCARAPRKIPNQGHFRSSMRTSPQYTAVMTAVSPMISC